MRSKRGIGSRLPEAGSRGVLDGRHALSLPGFAEPPYQPPKSRRDPKAEAKPVRLPTPRGWQTSRARNLDLVFAPDDSGSMYGPGGDPRGVRRAAALSVVDLVARARGARVGVVHWGSFPPAELTLPLTDVRDRRRIDAALAIPPSLGGNNFPAALARSREVLAESDNSRIRLVVCITDGIEIVGHDAFAELKVLPAGCVHVLLVDHSKGCTPALETAWAALPLGSFTRLELLDTTHTARQAAAVIARAVGLEMLPPPATTRTTSRRTP